MVEDYFMMAVLVRGKMNGQGTMTLKMGTSIQVISIMEPLMGKVPFNQKMAGNTKVIL